MQNEGKSIKVPEMSNSRWVVYATIDKKGDLKSVSFYNGPQEVQGDRPPQSKGLKPHVHTLDPRTGVRNDERYPVRKLNVREENRLRQILSFYERHDLREMCASWTWDPDPTIQEFYDMCRDESEFFHNGYHYHLLWSETIEHGFDVACQNLNDLSVAYIAGWEEAIPRESFKSRMELISQFRLKNDGRTILEYYCDYYHKPRLLVPPVPTDYPNW